jgi:hypothetical protein
MQFRRTFVIGSENFHFMLEFQFLQVNVICRDEFFYPINA